MGFFERVRDRVQPSRRGRINIQSFGHTAVSRGFANASVRVKDMRPAGHMILDWLLETLKERFDEEGPGWDALAPRTERERKRLGIGGAHPILDRTGATYDDHEGGQLMRSLTVKGDENQEVKITRGAFAFESTVDYGKYLQATEGHRPFELTAVQRKVPLSLLHEHVMNERGRLA